MVELWEKNDPYGFSWTKLRDALKKLVENRHQRIASTGSTDTDDTILCESPANEDDIKKRIGELENKFSSLIKGMVKQLRVENKKIEDVHETLLLGLPQPLSVLYSDTLEKKYDQLASSKSHLHFFSRLDNCWNFIDFDLLEYVIKRHGGDNLKSEMENYRRDFNKLCEVTTVYELIKYWKPLKEKKSDIPEDFRECMVKLNWKAETCKVQELENLRSDIKNCLDGTPTLSKAAIFLAMMAVNCVIVVWIVSKEIVSELSDGITQLIASNPEFIQKYEISYLLLDDLFLYYSPDLEKQVSDFNNHSKNQCSVSIIVPVLECL